MEYINAKLAMGEVNGTKILDHLTICHRLFVDDVGMFILAIEENFNKLQNTLRLYKVALIWCQTQHE